MHGRIFVLLYLTGGIGQIIVNGSTAESGEQGTFLRGITITQQHIDAAKVLVDHIFSYGERHSENQTSTTKNENTKIEEIISATAPNAVIHVGVFLDCLPFTAKQKDRFVGFEVDLMQLIAKEENLKCEFQCINATEMEQKLYDMDINIAIGALFKGTPTGNLGVSDGYLHTDLGIVTRKKHGENATKKLSFVDKRIGVSKNAHLGACTQLARIQGAEIITFNSTVEMINALLDERQKSLDFAIIDKNTAQHWIAKNPELTYISLNTPQEYAFYGIKGSSWLKTINCGIGKLLGTQKFMELKDRWSISEN